MSEEHQEAKNAPGNEEKGTLEGMLAELNSCSDKDIGQIPENEVTASGDGEIVTEDGVDWRKLTVGDWETRWTTDRTGFHQSTYHPKLVRYLENLVNGRKELKFFFPLCGKTMDMKWMYDEGHTVIGVEASVKAIEEFFLDNNLNYIADNVPEMEGVYKSEDNRIRIYCGDIYKFSSSIEKDMTAIFDRGSLVAINNCDRRRYADLLTSLMAPQVRYMLLTLDYDCTKYPGPPHYISVDEIEELYASQFNIELLSIEDAMEEKHKTWGLDRMEERVHLLSLKQ